MKINLYKGVRLGYYGRSLFGKESKQNGISTDGDVAWRIWDGYRLRARDGSTQVYEGRILDEVDEPNRCRSPVRDR